MTNRVAKKSACRLLFGALLFGALLFVAVLLPILPFWKTSAVNRVPQTARGEIIPKPSISLATQSQPPIRAPAGPSSANAGRKSWPSKFTNQYRMEFVLVPAGKFMMGSAEGNEDREKPAHAVTVAEPFYIGRYEVTQWQWHAVMTTTVDEQRRRIQQGAVASPRRMAGQNDSYPMYYVSWKEAHSFLQRLNALGDGYLYRLPSESEWEYACRAGGTAEMPGDLNAIAWYRTNSNDSVHDVGMRRPNAWGLYDMLGNVAEWCEDLYHPSYEGAPADATVWLATPDSLGQRVARGSSFFTGNLAFMKCGARGGETEDYRDFETGFRVVAVPRH